MTQCFASSKRVASAKACFDSGLLFSRIRSLPFFHSLDLITPPCGPLLKGPSNRVGAETGLLFWHLAVQLGVGALLLFGPLVRLALAAYHRDPYQVGHGSLQLFIPFCSA